MKRFAKIAVAALLLVGLCIGLFYLAADRHGTSLLDGNVVFADVREQIRKAKVMTWTTTFYHKVTSKDGKRSWVDTNTHKYAYKAPGLEREVMLKDDGQIRVIIISDAISGKVLSLVPEKKKAILEYLGGSKKELVQRKPDNPTKWLENCMKDELEWLGKREIAGRPANGFRNSVPGGSVDFWVDGKTKRLLRLQSPGINKYDPDKDPARKNPPEEQSSTMTGLALIHDDIRFDVELDDSLFSFEPPEGYTLEVRRRAEVTEKDMIEWLGVLTEYYGDAFPKRVAPFEFPLEMEEMNEILHKKKADRTPVEQKIYERLHVYSHEGFKNPLRRFIEHTAGDSWQYVGKGVKRGDKDRIVCWYKSKDSATYRVVYGDLTIKDVAPEDLPLSGQPK